MFLLEMGVPPAVFAQGIALPAVDVLIIFSCRLLGWLGQEVEHHLRDRDGSGAHRMCGSARTAEVIRLINDALCDWLRPREGSDLV